jgi:translation initiation factor IF-1
MRKEVMSKSDTTEHLGTVLASLPNTMFRVALEDGEKSSPIYQQNAHVPDQHHAW